LVAERVRDPARNVVRATLLGLALVLAIYMIVSTGIVLASPADELYASSAPIAYFVARFLGPWAGDAVALFAAISAIGCLNGLILFMGELPLGMVRDGQLPEYMAPTNRHDVAARPLLLGCFLAVALMLASVTGMGDRVLDFLLRLTTASAIWFYAGVCIAALLVRMQRTLALVGLGFCLWVLYGTGLEAGGLGIVLILVAVPLHFLMGGRTRARGTTPAS
jgi:APA family basic amino acid/polyamine antiporter